MTCFCQACSIDNPCSLELACPRCERQGSLKGMLQIWPWHTLQEPTRIDCCKPALALGLPELKWHHARIVTDTLHCQGVLE